MPDFAEKYGAITSLATLKAGGASAAEIEKADKMAEFARMYKNPLFVMTLMTYLEILPVGIVVSLSAHW